MNTPYINLGAKQEAGDTSLALALGDIIELYADELGDMEKVIEVLEAHDISYEV